MYKGELTESFNGRDVRSQQTLMNKTQEDTKEQARESRRRFLKKAGAIAVAVPVMESLSKEGILIRSAHAQTGQFDGLGGPMAGPIFEPV